MDLTTLAATLLLALGLLGANAVIHANSIIVEVAAPPKTDKVTIDQTTLEQEFQEQVFSIAKVTSVVLPPEIHASNNQGIGMALAKEANLENVAYALQSELGYNPDKLRFALYLENGSLRGLVSGSGHNVGSFRQVLVPQQDETVLAFVRRGALWGASQLAPYVTALYLVQLHAPDKDFTDVVALIEQAKNRLPPAPINFDRSAFDNLLGIIALFRNDPKAAAPLFEQAITEYPPGSVAVLNAAFTDLQLDRNQSAADRMEALVRQAPPDNRVLLSTAYVTWSAAEMARHDYKRADQLLAQSVQINPDSTTALDLWAELKDLMGDKAAATELRQRTLQSSETFENYGEVATLYFHLSWQDNQPVTRSKFSNPAVVTFH